MFVLVESHLDAHTQRASIGRLQKLLLLKQNGVFVYELLESPVVGFIELIYSVLDVDVLVVVVHYGEHHLYFDRLVRQILEENAKEIFAISTGAIRIKDEPPIGRLFSSRTAVVIAAAVVVVVVVWTR